MSRCPQCHLDSDHLGVVVPWDGPGDAQVLHLCVQHGKWLEAPKDQMFIAAKVADWLQTAPQSVAPTWCCGSTEMVQVAPGARNYVHRSPCAKEVKEGT